MKAASQGTGGKKYNLKIQKFLTEQNPVMAYGIQGKSGNKRSVWTVSTKPFKGAHFATFPEALIIPCILAGCPEGGNGALTLSWDPEQRQKWHMRITRNYVGFEINHEYIEIANKRLTGIQRKLFA